MDIIDTKESIANSLDASNNGTMIYEYLPYILQDIEELGTSPDEIINIIERNKLGKEIKRIIDIGCGKGAVSIKLALAYGYEFTGIDGMTAFINEAKQKAEEQKVNNLCTFETNDIRNVSFHKEFDAAILGAVGNLFGTFELTLNGVKRFVKDGGYIFLDDAFFPDGSQHKETSYLNESLFYKTIEQCGLEVIDKKLFEKSYLEESDSWIFESIIKRCNELKAKHPDKAVLFDSYIASQEKENNTLENELICGVFLLKSK